MIARYLPNDLLIVGECVCTWKTPPSPTVTKLPPVINVLEHSCWALVSARFAIEVEGDDVELDSPLCVLS